MQYSALLLLAAAASTSAQVTYDPTTGKFTCPASMPNGAFCAGDSLSTNIIIRCTNGVGQPGNCNDNLAGYFPFGVQPAQCWQTSPTSGDAACAKNCIVQASTPFTLPSCTPIPNPSASSSTTTLTSTLHSTSTVTLHPVTMSTTVKTTTSSATSILPTGGYTYPNNGTKTVYPTGTAAPTKTPVGPSGTTTASPTYYTGAAMSNSAGLSLAMVGLFAAYFM